MMWPKELGFPYGIVIGFTQCKSNEKGYKIMIQDVGCVCLSLRR